MMQNTKLCLQRRSVLRIRECFLSIWQKRTARIPLQNVSMATNQLNENKGGISAGCAYFLVRNYCAPSPKQDDQIDVAAFEKVCDETLDSLTEYFEEIVEAAAHLDGADVTYGSGVLTVTFGKPYGTYVINRQTPNRQIWLSSPVSGPKRYDFVEEQKCWIYKHNGRSLHELLQEEIPKITRGSVDFSRCVFSRLKK